MQETNPASPDEPAPHLDRRVEDRSPPPAQPTFVWVSMDRRIQAEIVDESPRGLGLVLPRVDRFEIGFQVRVESSHGRRTATIAYLEELEGDRCRMGLTWEAA